MSEIRGLLQNALQDLDTKVARIEQIVEQKLQDANQNQHDLFAGGAQPGADEKALQKQDAANANGGDDIDPAAVARRLDKAIGRVEQLLKEG